ncbi:MULTISPECIES: ABC transporter substrate-binding protein [unclassified Blastococcus]
MSRSSRFPALTRVAPLAVAMTLAMAACGGDDGGEDDGGSTPAAADTSASPEWQQVIDAAEEEGAVTIYSSQGTEQLEELASRFEDTYDIDVTINRDVDANIEARLDAEDSSGSPAADVVAIADGAYIARQGEAGWWEQPTGPAFDDPAYNRAEYVAEAGSFFTSAAVFVIGWNTQFVPDGLESYEDLLNPDLQGNVGVTDPATSPAVVDFYDFVIEQTSDDFIDELAAQEPQIFASVLPAAQALTSGEIYAAMAVQALVDERDQGAPVDFVVPEPAWGAPFHTAVLAEAPHPNAGQLLANFMITEAGQEAIAAKAASVLPDIETSVTTLDNVDAFDPTTLDPARVEEFRAQFQAAFQ